MRVSSRTPAIEVRLYESFEPPLVGPSARMLEQSKELGSDWDWARQRWARQRRTVAVVTEDEDVDVDEDDANRLRRWCRVFIVVKL